MSELLNFAKIVPEWMDQSFFTKVVRHMERDPNAKVVNFNVVAGSKPGDNYASSLYRATIDYNSKFTKSETKTLSLIIKTQILKGIKDIENIVKESPAFRNEMEMYGKVLPAIQALWKMIGDDELLFPKMIYQSTEPLPLIILEDMSVEGFEMIEKPLEDIEVNKKIFQRLAKFHASTFFLQDENRQSYEHFTSILFTNPTLVDFMFNQSLDAFIYAAKKEKDFERYISNLEAFKESFARKCMETCSSKGQTFNVLNHGDFHIKNLLFKKDNESKIESFCFLDFQGGVYTTPAMDLFYCLYFMVSPENRRKHRDELIAIYHQQFVSSLKSFGYLKAPPSLIDLNIELLKNGHFEVLVAIIMIIIFYFDPSTLTPDDMDMGEGTKRAKRRLYGNQEYLSAIKEELPGFVFKGFL